MTSHKINKGYLCGRRKQGKRIAEEVTMLLFRNLGHGRKKIQDKGKKNLKTGKNLKIIILALYIIPIPTSPLPPFSLLFVHFLFLSIASSFLNLLWTFSLSIKKKKKKKTNVKKKNNRGPQLELVGLV